MIPTKPPICANCSHSKLHKPPLPRVTIFDPHHHLEGKGVQAHWVGATVEAEVLSLHLEKRTMRVRLLEKVQWTDDDAPRSITFDCPIDPFLARYTIIEAKRAITMCQPADPTT